MMLGKGAMDGLFCLVCEGMSRKLCVPGYMREADVERNP